MMPHAQSLQVQLPDGTISGKLKQNLPPIINTNISLQQLAQYIYYSEEQMKFIDWANYHITSKSFTPTGLSQAHACKTFSNLWYTDTQAHKFNNNLSTWAGRHFPRKTFEDGHPSVLRITRNGFRDFSK